jgi:hypothetical protein
MLQPKIMQPMSVGLGKRFVILILLALCPGGVLASAAQAAELVMYRRDGCAWCARWDREIGPIYPKTEFSARAPLRHINLDHDSDAGIIHAPIRYTPTFVLAEAGRELGRIEGYPGDEFFWFRLEQLLEFLPTPAPAPKGVAAPDATQTAALERGR